jgi:hypothetical protein
VFGAHGAVGANLFLLIYLSAVLNPMLRILSSPTSGVKAIALVVVLATAAVTMTSIRAQGGGGAGEPVGCLAGTLAWLGRFAAPALGSYLAPASGPDSWRILGASIPPVLVALGLWLRSRSER